MAPWGQAIVPRDDAPTTRDPWAWALALARTNEEELAVKEALQVAAKEARARYKKDAAVRLARMMAERHLSAERDARALSFLVPLCVPTIETVPLLAPVVVDALMVDGPHLSACWKSVCHMAEHTPKELMIMWPRLVPNDEHEGVFRSPLRTADACRLLSLVFEHAAGSWAMARDKSQARPATFTSHSERIGAYVVHTRAALAARLGASCDAAAVLACIRALVIYAPDTALHTSHESVLRAHIEPWLASELEACMYAYAILALWPQPPIDAVPRLLPHAPKAPYAWDVIATYIDMGHEVPWGQLLPLLLQTSCWTPCHARVLVSILKRAQGAYAAEFSILMTQLQQVAQDVACHVWPDYVVTTRTDASVRLLEPLLQHSEADIRARAIRALGVLYTREEAPRSLLTCLHAYIRLVYDAAILVRIRAAWAWANACAHTHDIALYDAMRHGLDDDDRVAVHAVRGLGCLLPHMPWPMYQEGVQCACRVLEHSRTPKVRWNAATCVSRAMEHNASEPTLSLCVWHLARALGHDTTFKVRRVAAQALQAVPDEVLTHVSPSAQSALRDAVTQADTHLTAQMHAASFAEAQLHGHACVAYVQALRKRIASL